MGLTPPETVLFDGQVPDIQRIAAKVSELSGLAVRVRLTVDRHITELYEMDGVLAFECAPRDEIHLSVYRPGGYSMSEAYFDDLDPDNEHYRNAAPDAPYAEPPGKQTLRLRIGFPLERTFRSYVFLALEALGGEAKHPLDETSRRLCVGTITALELRRRKWAASGLAARDMLRSGVSELLYVIAEAFGIRFPHRPPHEAGRRERHLLVRIALFPFRLFFALLGATFLALILPLVTAYHVVTFAAKTAGLAFHMLTETKNAADPSLTGAARSARNILNDMKDRYGAPHKLIPVSEADFRHLNLRKYAQFRADMERLGYRYVGDFELTERSRTTIATIARTMVRIMATQDGSTGASYYQFRQLRWPLLKALVRDMLRLKWISAPKHFAKDIQTRHCVEISTAFDDGRWLAFSNAETADKITMPTAMERHFFPYGTGTAVLLDAHRERMAEILEASPSVRPLVCRTAEDVTREYERLAQAKCAHRASLRWITQDELRALANGNVAFADEVYAEIQNLLAQEEAAVSSMSPPG